MNYKIEDKQAFEMFGVSTVVSVDGFIEIPAFWTKYVSDGTVDRIRTAAELGENGQIHGINYNKGKNYSYMIGYFLPQSGLQGGFEKLHISPKPTKFFQPASTQTDRVVFLNCGSVFGGNGFRPVITNS